MEKKVDEAGRLDVKVPSVDEVLKKKHPETKFRAGSVSATIWKNSRKDDKGKEIFFRTISFEKGYQDKDGNWQNTNVLRTSDLPKATLVLQKAYEYIYMQGDEQDE